MIDPVIDEHFRRSLGADYADIFEKRSSPIAESVSNASPRSSPKSRLASPIATTKSPTSTSPSFTITPIIDTKPTPKQTINVEMSVDDHFAKALGDTWKKLQEADRILPSPSSICSTGTSKGGDYDDDDDDDANSTSS